MSQETVADMGPVLEACETFWNDMDTRQRLLWLNMNKFDDMGSCESVFDNLPMNVREFMIQEYLDKHDKYHELERLGDIADNDIKNEGMEGL